jgi:dTDP-4-amino-4,6-dideoxygalactose transaminase
MINISKNLNYKIKFCDLNYDNGFFKIKNLKKKINKNTIAVVLTNMFNSYEDTIFIRNICKQKKVILIEDNAIFFDNYKIIKNKRIYSGSFGSYSLYSFNIMKNISALYGGGIATNDIHFKNFAVKEISKYSNFPNLLLIKQSVTYLILKVLSITFLYKILFFRVVKYAHLKNNLFLLKIFYPSLKFSQKKFPSYYFTKISDISKKLVYLQLQDLKSRALNHKIRKTKNIYYQYALQKKNIKGIKLLPIRDFNFQNLIDFPILVKDKKNLNKFLLHHGIETRTVYYRNCNKIFNIQKLQSSTAEKYENEIICLPNHRKITKKYIDYMIDTISNFYSKKIFSK